MRRWRPQLFYTATWPRAVRALAYEFLRNPVQVEVGDINSLNANKDITQVVHLISGQQQKTQILHQIFGTLEAGSRVIIFTSTKRMCDQLGMQLMRMIGDPNPHPNPNPNSKFNPNPNPNQASASSTATRTSASASRCSTLTLTPNP